MKHHYKLFLLIALFFAPFFNSVAQFSYKFSDPFVFKGRRYSLMSDQSGIRGNDYTFSKKSGTYANLSGATSINKGIVWEDTTFSIPVGFKFAFFDKFVDSVEIDDGLIGNYGYNIDPVNFSFTGHQYFIAGNSADLIDRGYDTPTSQSPVSYKIDGTAGNRICKIEWKNAGFYNEYISYLTIDDYVNFQIWLYENNGDIEIHYGPSKITEDTLNYDGEKGPGVGLGKINFIDSTATTDFYSLNGDPLNPILDFSEEGSYLSGTPSNGTIYKFSRTSQLGIDKNTPSETKIKVFPNPMNDQCTIHSGVFLNNAEVKLINVAGQVVENISHISGSTFSFSRNNLPAGIYFLKLTEGKNLIYGSKMIIAD